MSPPTLSVLQRLGSLDKSSPEFHDQLSNALCGKEYMRCVPDLQDGDIRWLIDYLDEARCRAVVHCSLPNPA